jgi:predicted kinase
MEMVIFIGAQASGKSSFFRNRFSDSHIRINLDMLKTRNRESTLINACLEAKQSFVVDNTNSTIKQRTRYFHLAEMFPNVAIRGIYFQSSIDNCIRRNQGRAVQEVVPEQAIVATVRKLEIPTYSEGFGNLQFVRISNDGFVVEEWINEL